MAELPSIQLPIDAPKGWLNTPEGHELLHRRSEWFAIMSARHAKLQAKKPKP